MDEQTKQELKTYVEIPSISTDPKHKPDIARAQQFLTQKLSSLGFTTELLPTSGNAALFAEKITNPAKQTLLIYGHYDVQPADVSDGWNSEPFTLTEKDGNLYARGITDNKAPLFVVIKAIEQLITTNQLDINIKFIIEGEEELGSKHFHEIVVNHKDKLHCEAIFVSDSLNITPENFCVLYGMRGLVYAHIRVDGPPQDQHSGTFGGVLKNPHQELVRILDSCRDEDGKLAIPQANDGIRHVTPEEMHNFALIPFPIPNAPTYGDLKLDLLLNAWCRPTFEIHGISGGYTQPGKKTIIPSFAEAKVSIRLVPDQDPQHVAEALKSQVYSVCPHAKVTIDAANPALLVDPNGPLLTKTRAIIEEITGNTAYLTRSGGTIPAIAMLHEALGVDVVEVGLGLPDDGMHSPNEKFNIERFDLGVKVFSELFKRLF